MWKPPTGGVAVLSFCFLTTRPNQLLRALHDRMPVILWPDEYVLWLDRDAGTADVRSLLDQYPADEMLAVTLTTRINWLRSDDPACLKPLHS